MVVYQDYSERIKEIRAHFNMNKTEFAAFTKTHGSILSEYESRNREPSKEFIKTLSEIGISVDWFLTGDGSMLLKPQKRLDDAKSLHERALKEAIAPFPDTPVGEKAETPGRKPPGIPLVFESDKEFEDGIVIPVLGDNPVSAGHGASIGDDEAPTRYIHAPRELAKYPHLMSLPVKGDSMDPTLHDGDMVVCDGGGWDGDGVYVIKTSDEAFVKRVLHTSKGYQIISDNKTYPNYSENREDLMIVGKVRAAVIQMPGRRGGI